MTDTQMVPVKITPEMAYELESNFAECVPPSPVHAANWQKAWAKCLAAAPSVQPDSWQDISTYPGDGYDRCVLVTESDGSVCEARLLDDGRGWWSRGNDPTDHWGEELFPTHWRPLPAPPAAPTGDA